MKNELHKVTTNTIVSVPLPGVVMTAAIGNPFPIPLAMVTVGRIESNQQV